MSDGIVIAGGGFAGFWAAVAARRVAPGAPVTLVSRGPHLDVRPRLYEVHSEDLRIDLRPLLALVEVDFVQAEITAIDVERRQLASTGARLPYERLVLATGSVMRRPPIRGAERCWSIDTWSEAARLDRRLAELARGARPSTVAVVGAGFTGIELALELRTRLEHHGGPAAARDLRVVLVDRAPSVGVELGDGPRPAIEAALHEARVELQLGADIVTLEPTQIALASGQRIECDAVVLATGLVAAPLAGLLPGTHDRFGRVAVDAHLVATESDPSGRVLVAGDAAAADTGSGHTTLMSCQHALQLGRVAGENAARSLSGMALIDYRQTRYVTCLDLGQSGAVFTTGWEREVQLTGEAAKRVKRRINTEIIYPPPGADRQALLAASEIVLPGRTRSRLVPSSGRA